MENDRRLAPGEQSAQISSTIYAPATPAPRTSGIPQLNWDQAIRIQLKHWRLSTFFAFALVILVTIVSFRMRPIYEPSARLEIDPPGTDVFSLKDLMNAGSNDQDYVETQVQNLKSDELAIEVIRTLRLDQNIEFVGKKALDAEGREPSEESASRTQLTSLENIALRTFQKRLGVLQVRNSRLVEVTLATHDPQLSAQVLNTLVNLFIDRNYRTRYETTMQASEWLSGQLSDLRKRVEQSTQALVDYQRANGIVEDSDQGQTSVQQKMGELAKQLVQAQADRIQLEAYLKLEESGSGDSLPPIRSNDLLQALTKSLVDSKGQLAQALAVYGKNNPTVKKPQGQVDELASQVSAERTRVVDELKTGFQGALEREQMMAQAMNDMKGVIGDLNEKMIHYRVLKNESIANAELYNLLLARLKEAGISAGLKSSNIRVVDDARVLDAPTRPNRLLNITLGLIGGLLGGVMLAFIVEKLDNTVRTPDDIKECTGLSSLALFPINVSRNGDGRGRFPSRASRLLGNGKKQEVDPQPRYFLERPHSAEAEAVRTLYTSVMLSRAGNPPQVMLTVSASPGEGKTTVSLNLATALAQHARTCLVEADLRRPRLGRIFGLDHPQGLTNVLTGSGTLDTATVGVPDLPNLTLLLSGPIPPNPAELVSSQPMQEVVKLLRARFDHVVIDSPPIIPFADARVLSPLVDGVILVGRCGWTTRQALIRSAEILEVVRAHVLGVVINAMDLSSPEYRYYHYGRYYDYGYSSKYGYGYGGSGYGYGYGYGDEADEPQKCKESRDG